MGGCPELLARKMVMPALTGGGERATGSGDEPDTPDQATARGRIALDVKAALGKVRIRRI